MRRVFVIVAAAALALTAIVSGQNGSGLDAQALKGLELRSIGPSIATVSTGVPLALIAAAVRSIHSWRKTWSVGV